MKQFFDIERLKFLLALGILLFIGSACCNSDSDEKTEEYAWGAG